MGASLKEQITRADDRGDEGRRQGDGRRAADAVGRDHEPREGRRCTSSTTTRSARSPASEVKKRTESIEAFDAAGRTELADKERAERAVLEPYAPAQLDDSAVEALIDEAFAATGASGPQDMGKVMGYVMGKAKGQVDGGAVQRKVKERLSG